MKIKSILINGFGKLSNKNIELKDNINIIYGKNEAGKSTLLNYIKAMFYGVARNKNGKEISDFDKFTPWNIQDYSGKISYSLDNGEEFEIYRDFRKKSPIIYNSQKQDITNEFLLDKNKGIDVIYEQLGIDEESIKNTIIVSQNEIEVEKNSQNHIIQKISNIVSSGDENISFRKTMDRINKTQLEEVGTDRTTEKPINIVTKRINELTIKKNELEEIKNSIDENDVDLGGIQNNISEESTKLELLKTVRDNLEKSNLKYAEIDVLQKIKEENEAKVDELKYKVDRRTKRKIANEKKSYLMWYILILFLLILTIVSFVVKFPIALPIISFVLAVIISMVIIYKIYSFRKDKASRIREIEKLEEKINQEANIIKENIKLQDDKIKQKEQEIKDHENRINLLIVNEFEKKLNLDFIQTVLEMNLEEIDIAINHKVEYINSLKWKISSNEQKKEILQSRIDEFPDVQAQLENAVIEKEELSSLNKSFDLAKECMESAYEKIRSSINPEFNENLCQIVEKISNGKYKKVSFNDVDGLIVETENGMNIPVNKLSQGTIDQMYLSLRLSSINTITKENIFIILDETFAFFDDERLENILKFINNNYKDKQVLIFTCSNREMQILDKLKIEYNKIEL